VSGNQTRSARARREFWKRLGIWIFICVFAFSVVGGAIAVVASLFAGQH
jgi:ABC-type Fe3+ transport system permease subunit